MSEALELIVPSGLLGNAVFLDLLTYMKADAKRRNKKAVEKYLEGYEQVVLNWENGHQAEHLDPEMAWDVSVDLESQPGQVKWVRTDEPAFEKLPDPWDIPDPPPLPDGVVEFGNLQGVKGIYAAGPNNTVQPGHKHLKDGVEYTFLDNQSTSVNRFRAWVAPGKLSWFPKEWWNG